MAVATWTKEIPMPDIPRLAHVHSVLIGGIGGTGVVTIGQTLAMAAHVEGYYSSNLDVTGLAQKYGSVSSHVRVAPSAAMLHSTRIPAGEADTMIACDLVVAASDESFSRLVQGRTRAVICTDLVPTADFASNPDWHIDAEALEKKLRSMLGVNGLFFNGQLLAMELMGDPIAANMLMLGAAWQSGQIPLSINALHRAIELNGVAVEMNMDAFTWGRRIADDLSEVRRFIARNNPSQVINIVPRLRRSVDDIVEHRSNHLVLHTGKGLAARYRAMVERVRAAESGIGTTDALTRAVAHNYHRLLAVKDEWEVARLYSHPDFKAAIDKEFEGNFKIRYHVGAWPFAKTDKHGNLVKGEAGPWLLGAFRLLSRLKALRGTIADPFRKNSERRLDQKLLTEYESDIEVVLDNLDATLIPTAARLLSLPQSIRGYGHVKMAQAEGTRPVRTQLLAELLATKRLAA